MPDTNIPQKSIDGYRFTARIAQGGAGVVYKAVKSPAKPPRAVKVLHARLLKDKQTVTAFKNEFEIGSTLRHPGIIRYYKAGALDGCPYMMMEFFPSNTVNAVIGNPELYPLQKKLRQTVTAMAEALFYMHEHGVLHCDIKPDNYLLGEDGAVRLIDFSIARRYKRKDTVFQRVLKGLQKEKISGTPSYMPPEQIKGGALRPAADIYAFGVTLFEMVTGRLPFVRNSEQEVLAAQVHEAPPTPRMFCKNISNALDRLITSMMDKDPAARPASLAEVLTLLKDMPLYKKIQ